MGNPSSIQPEALRFHIDAVAQEGGDGKNALGAAYIRPICQSKLLQLQCEDHVAERQL